MLSARGTYTSDHLLQSIAHTHATTAAHIVYQPGELRAVWAALGACVRRALIFGSGPALISAPASAGGSAARARPSSAAPLARPSSSSALTAFGPSAVVVVGGGRVATRDIGGAAAPMSRQQRPSSAGAAPRPSSALSGSSFDNSNPVPTAVCSAVSLFRKSIFFWTSPTTVATEAAGFHRNETRYCVRTPQLGFGTSFATTYGLNSTTANGRQSLLAPQSLLSSGGGLDDVALSSGALAAEARVPQNVATACLADIVRSVGEALHAGRVLQLQLPSVGTILLKADRVQAHWDPEFVAALVEADTRRWPAEVAAIAMTRFLPSTRQQQPPREEARASAAPAPAAHTVQAGDALNGDEEEFEDDSQYRNSYQRQQQPEREQQALRRPPSIATSSTRPVPMPFRPASGGPCTVEELDRRADNVRRARIVHAAAKYTRSTLNAEAPIPSGFKGRPPLNPYNAGFQQGQQQQQHVDCHYDPLASVTPPMAVCCDEVVPSSLLPRAIAGRLADGTPVRMGRQESVYDMVLPPPPPAVEVLGVKKGGSQPAGLKFSAPVSSSSPVVAPDAAADGNDNSDVVAVNAGVRNYYYPHSQSSTTAAHGATGAAGEGIQQQQKSQQQHHHHTHTHVFGFRPQSAQELQAVADAEWGPTRGRKRF